MHIATSWAAPSNGPHFSPVQHHRQALGPVRPGDGVRQGRVMPSMITVSKQEFRQALALGYWR